MVLVIYLKLPQFTILMMMLEMYDDNDDEGGGDGIDDGDDIGDDEEPEEFPPLSPRHLRALTTLEGCLQMIMLVRKMMMMVNLVMMLVMILVMMMIITTMLANYSEEKAEKTSPKSFRGKVSITWSLL